MRKRLSLAMAAAMLVLAACSSDGSKPPAGQSPTSPTATSPAPTGTSAPAFSLSAVKIRLQRLVSGLSSPVFVTHAGDGSGLLYVVEQTGRIRVFERSGKARGTFLDIAGRVQSGGERGLLGLAFHPEYESNGRFFVYYSDNAGDNVVSEFRRRSATAADTGSERALLRMDDPFSNHNGGWLSFGPDGFLYIATGDGGSAGDPQENGQSLRTLLGKILRVDVNGGSPYAIPPANPFVEREGARKEIWAYGLRNPWRNSFDRATGDLWIGDVGQNSREEVNVQKGSSEGGGNYGWNIMEGNSCFRSSSCNRSGLIRPVVEYPTADGCAVTGGYVYRGAAFPTLVGAYFFADYCNGRIFALDAARATREAVSERRVLDTEISISSFGEDENGELYVIGHGGTVHRLLAA
ncbi:MAG: PQQ-dependent sugar dehydrogenase [Actinomycetota bacterium]